MKLQMTTVGFCLQVLHFQIELPHFECLHPAVPAFSHILPSWSNNLFNATCMIFKE